MGRVFAKKNIYKGRDASWEAVFDCTPFGLERKKREYYDGFFQLKGG